MPLAHNHNSLDFLKSIWSMMLGAAVGIYIGLNRHDLVPYVEPIGTIYLAVLKMCILPILVSAISVAIGRLMNTPTQSNHLQRLLFVIGISLIFASTLGLLIGIVGQPGAGLDDESLSSLGAILRQQGALDLELQLFQPYNPQENESLLKAFFFTLVPSNIFEALSTGANLKVLFFSILFGLAIGSLNKNASQTILDTLDATCAAFSKLVQWLMYLLPFGLCGLIAESLSHVGMNVLVAMMNFVPWALGGFLVLLAIGSIMLWLRTGSLVKSVVALKEPIIIALGTANGLAAIPSAMTSMKKLGYDPKTVDLLIPLSFTLCRIGPTVYFATAAMFIAQLYNVEMNIERLAIVVFASILAGMATAGSSGIVLLSMLALVLTPLQLPFDAVIVLFIVIDPIIAPFRVLSIIYVACAITAVILPKPLAEKGEEKNTESATSIVPST
ncbi:dicarboxylate/amino acid:cation symporter [Halioglobus sp. HI00S01]|uniref:dicarboxylate/amino acid:cation symporter n=1 Tax=Halioglobus sp. HI00S01 TaxID=1822214 RepID=UPI0018D29831|nr:cation:dicarboxylase symporter family transporter [Halioglobus sp. HI00S01]